MARLLVIGPALALSRFIPLVRKCTRQVRTQFEIVICDMNRNQTLSFSNLVYVVIRLLLSTERKKAKGIQTRKSEG
ncbi:hypothetical protein F4810DRAFT_674050 [Camillea tinctor]|nr:hypothetical protein F4810DRAFT_674050 [Camillea tinctor]